MPRSPIYTIYNNFPTSSNLPLTPPPEYSPPLPSIIDTEHENETQENSSSQTTRRTVINYNDDEMRTTDEGVATAVHQNQLNQVRLIYDDFCDNNNINTSLTRSNYFQYMNEYNAINLDNYRNYVREINNTIRPTSIDENE